MMDATLAHVMILLRKCQGAGGPLPDQFRHRDPLPFIVSPGLTARPVLSKQTQWGEAISQKEQVDLGFGYRIAITRRVNSGSGVEYRRMEAE